MNCVSCGEEALPPFQKYNYCGVCDEQRRNEKPIIAEYQAGVLGWIPNSRSIEYYFKDWEIVNEVQGLSIYGKAQEYSNYGTRAIMTADNGAVIVANDFEITSLLDHPCRFADNPTLDILPRLIESENPDYINTIIEARKQAGLDK